MENSFSKTGEVNKSFLYAFIFILGVGAVQYGYSIGVYNAMQKDFEHIFGWKSDEVNLWNGLITSICALGSAVGSLFAGAPADMYGKKSCIHATNVLLVIGCSLTLVQNEYWILGGRFLFGLCAGAFSVFVPSFINELAPNELKGSLGSLTQILITLGIFIANAFGLPLPEVAQGLPPTFINDQYWRVVFGMPIAFALFQSIMLATLFNYETPKYLKKHKKEEELQKIMARIYPLTQIDNRVSQIVIEGAGSSPGYKETLCHPRYAYATFVGCMLSILQQLSGINAVMFYSSAILGKFGISANIGTAVVGLVNMVSTFPTVWLMDKFGRRSLLWTLSLVQAVLLVGLGVSYIYVGESNSAKYLAVFFVMAFVVMFELSLGPVPWVYMSETMTERGLSLAVGLNWIFTIVIGLVTPILLDKIGGYFFIGNGAFTVVCALFCLFIMKETKGLSAQDVAQLYSKGKKQDNSSGEMLDTGDVDAVVIGQRRSKKYAPLEEENAK
ncbi:hypothetical protein FGO68_gene14650 [Halteria grandinella]|uniref:Hexose transporter 1 n=1 Tax=Halteria grandinella TaxID=5974 RepID=A0A8J8NSA8_HALGN|nr:hypothetical protein FGO68_gene14650 [Halteria grandinella]